MANAFMTLADWARRVGPDGSIDEIAELLSQCNDIFKDMLWREGNLPFGHKSTLRTSLPAGTWRMAYQGVPYTKSTTAQITDACGELVAYSQIDKTVAEQNGEVMQTRKTEDDAHLEGLSQQMATTIFYGNSSVTLSQFTGFAPRFNTVCTSTAQNAVNVLNAAGTQSANASIWLIGWGDRTTYGIFPKSSKAGLTFEDKGDTVPAYDSNNNRYEAYTSYFRWLAGLSIEDWRYIVRVANIDTTNTTVGLPSATPPDLFALMSKAVVRLPTMTMRVSGITETDAPDEVSPGIAPAWYCNRTVREYLDLQAIRDKNVLLGPKDYAGGPVIEFRGVPIRVCDALLSTEATLT